MKLGSQEMTEIELGEINTVNNSLNPMSDSTCLTKPSSSNRRFNATTCSFPSQKYSSEHDVLGNLMHSKLNSKSKIQKKKPKIISNTNSLKVIFTEWFVRFWVFICLKLLDMCWKASKNIFGQNIDWKLDFGKSHFKGSFKGNLYWIPVKYR